MDDAWPARWPPPPPPPLTPPSLLPQPNQMDSVSLRYLFRPFVAQDAIAVVDSRAATIQEPLVSNPFSSQPGQPAKVGLSNSFVAQVPNAPNAGGINDLTRVSSLSGVTPLSKYPRHCLSASSFDQVSLGAPLLTKSGNAHSGFPGEGSAVDGISQGPTQFHTPALQKLSSKSIPRHHPTLLGDHLRLSCLNVGGEFFVGEAGLFGVICFCHWLKMSVAKFCEHSGAPAEKAGEIVRMENGMSIAQWFKYCIGVGSSIADTNWDWPEWVCTKNYPDEYRLKNLPTRNNNKENLELIGGFGKMSGPMNMPSYSNNLYVEGGGCTSAEKILNKPDETCHRSVDVRSTLIKSSTLQQNAKTTNLALATNHTVHAMKRNPVSRPIGSPDLAVNKGGNYNGDHLASNNDSLFEKYLDASFLNPRPSSTGVLNYDGRTARSDFPHRIFQDSPGIASNTELKLGQSSYHQSMASLFPSLQSTVLDFQKPQSHQQLIIRNVSPRQAIQVNRSLQEQTESPCAPGNKKQALEGFNGIDHSEGDHFADDAAKNSFISLFLSHLERNNTLESVDDIFNNNDHCLPKVLDGACSSDISKNTSKQFEVRASDNHSMMSPTMVHTKKRSDDRSQAKQKSDDRSLSMTSMGYISQDLPRANNQESLIHGDCMPHLLPNQPSAGISKMCTEVSCPANCRNCKHATDTSHQVTHNDTGVPCLYHKMAREHHTCEHDDLCTHKKSRTLFEIGCHYGRSCCLSAHELLPSFGQNDQSTLEKSIHGCCWKLHQDVSKFGVKAGHLCLTCSNDAAPVLAHKPILEGSDKFCTCSTFAPRPSLCSRERLLQYSCHACPIDELHLISSMEHSTNSLVKKSFVEVPNKKEPGCCWEGRCCYSVMPKCLASCCFTNRHGVRNDQSNPIVTKNMDDAQTPAKCCTLGESDNLRFDPCQCSNNRSARRSNSQASCWKDVSSKVINHPSPALSERLNNFSESSAAGGNRPYGVVTEIAGAHRDTGVFQEQLKTGFSSVSSAAVLTKFSVSTEVNKIASHTAKYTDELNDLVFDEGSRIEKCSSSSYEPIRAKHGGTINSFSKLHLDSAKVKRNCNQIFYGCAVKGNGDEIQHFEMPRKTPRTLGCSAKYSESDDCAGKSFQPSQNEDSQLECGASSFSCRESKTKRKYPSMFLNKPAKRLHSNQKIFRSDDGKSDEEGFLPGALKNSRTKKVEGMATPYGTKHQKEGNHVVVRKLPKYVSLNCIVNEPNSEDACSGSECVDSSLIATGIMNDNRKSPKIVSLNLILKKAKRCQIAKPLCKIGNMPLSEETSSGFPVDKSYFGVRSSRNTAFGSKDCCPQVQDESQTYKKNRNLANTLKPHVDADCKSENGVLGENEPLDLIDAETSQPISVSRSTGLKNQRASASLSGDNYHEEFIHGPARSPSGDKENAAQVCQVNVGRHNKRLDSQLNSDASCCVCGSSSFEPCNQLMECSKCFLKVHQACYGVPKVPREQWLCRPCKTNAQDIVCVLCGYGGGAMTRALKTHNIVKSLLKGLTIGARPDRYVHSSENAGDECTQNWEYVKHASFYALRSTSCNTVSKMNLQKSIDNTHREEDIINNFQSSNNPNSSLLGPSTMQWVHVVCGLWTPGTKCPNATTMSAFDLSGASPGRRNTVCSMCNRTGGSFMQCRDVNCSVLFHPWCAHQKGLLQSEPEGEHNENIGFYGTCVCHATFDYLNSSHHANPKEECLRNNDWACARTEGFKGRKREDWSGANHKKSEDNSGECNVSQEQINAWLRINGSKSYGRGQKEYIHYNQLKGWKHLVVYKSGIHGLGLYTSQFIPRGAMVVEYVGEIVGQRVADKREIEYQSGRRQQYKSACYFFKIDKEHIIDATRKGGIARFVNHSCEPNCVAKIISVRNEKKVVFFAERHINPGEEITYDYHFNREDDGQRIPCFCRSKNCRRYLN